MVTNALSFMFFFSEDLISFDDFFLAVVYISPSLISSKKRQERPDFMIGLDFIARWLGIGCLFSICLWVLDFFSYLCFYKFLKVNSYTLFFWLQFCIS